MDEFFILNGFIAFWPSCLCSWFESGQSVVAPQYCFAYHAICGLHMA
jgi:hypothetical protein